MAAMYVGLLCLLIALCNSQKTPGFDDWTPAGTEREIDLLYQEINALNDGASEIAASVDKFDLETNARNQPSKNKISADITSAMNDVAGQALKAGYPLCAAKATSFKFTAIAKYQTQIHIGNDVYTASAFKTKVLARNLNAVLSNYQKKDRAVASMQYCRGPATAFFGNAAIVNCYKRQLAVLTNDVKNFNTAKESLNREFEVTKKSYNDFLSIVSKTLSDARTATDDTVGEVLDCAKLRTNNVDYGEQLIEELKLNVNSSIKTQVKAFNDKVDRAVDALNGSAAQYQENLKTQIITPLLEAYKRTFAIIPNQFLSLAERIASVNKFFDGYKDYAALLYEILRLSRYAELKGLVKTVDQNFDVAFAVFKADVTASKCIKTKKDTFLACIEPRLKLFLSNKTSAEKEISTQESVADFLISLNTSVPTRPNQRIAELLDSLKFDFDYQKYLAERSQFYLKTVVDATPSRVGVIDTVNNLTDLLNSLNVNFKNTLQTTLIPGDNVELKVYSSVRENQIQSKVDELTVLIESLKPKLQKAESGIQSRLEAYKDFVVYCDGSAYKACVDTHYDAKDASLSAAVNVFNGDALEVGAIKSGIENLKVEIEKTLREAEEKAQLEKEKTVNIETRKQLVLDAIKIYNDRLNVQTSTVDKAIAITKDADVIIKEFYDRVARNPNLQVLFSLGDVAFTKTFNDFGGCNSINITDGIYKGIGSFAQALRQVANQSMSVSDSYLYEQCRSSTSLTSYKECLGSLLVVPELDVTRSEEIINTLYLEV